MALVQDIVRHNQELRVEVDNLRLSAKTRELYLKGLEEAHEALVNNAPTIIEVEVEPQDFQDMRDRAEGAESRNQRLSQSLFQATSLLKRVTDRGIGNPLKIQIYQWLLAQSEDIW